jgi:hypothetical protein
LAAGFQSNLGVWQFAYRDKKVVGVFVRFSCRFIQDTAAETIPAMIQLTPHPACMSWNMTSLLLLYLPYLHSKSKLGFGTEHLKMMSVLPRASTWEPETPKAEYLSRHQSHRDKAVDIPSFPFLR